VRNPPPKAGGILHITRLGPPDSAEPRAGALGRDKRRLCRRISLACLALARNMAPLRYFYPVRGAVKTLESVYNKREAPNWRGGFRRPRRGFAAMIGASQQSATTASETSSGKTVF
jgi:hypothetical protein